MSQIFLFGATSMIGWSVLKARDNQTIVPFCNPHSRLEVCQDWQRIRLEEEDDYKKIFLKNTPTHIIHCGGICDVDKCEAQPDWAYEINVKGIDALLKFILPQTRLIYVSSDHVFGHGEKQFDENSQTQPLSVYARTRVEAEKKILSRRENTLLLRVGLGIGPSIDGRTGHLDWLRYRKKNNLPLTIVEDEIRSAVWAKDLGQRILDFATSDIVGIRHIAATNPISRPDLAKFLNKKFNIGAEFSIESRNKQKAPHLGRVELATQFEDKLSRPLTSVIE